MTAQERARQLFTMPCKQLPPLALDLMNKMVQASGYSPKVMLAAFEVYAFIFEGLPLRVGPWICATIPKSLYKALAEKFPGIYDLTPVKVIGSDVEQLFFPA